MRTLLLPSAPMTWAGASPSSVGREADRFVDAGILKDRRHGNLRLLQADTNSIIAKPLTDLLALTFGPAAVLAPLLEHVAGIDEAFIHGSWAARYVNQAGPPPRDVDVLKVGAADEDQLFDAARAAEQLLGREVDITQIPPSAWTSETPDPFVASVRSRPRYPPER